MLKLYVHKKESGAIMRTFYPDYEFNNLIAPIICNEEYQKTKKITHHGMTRYDHMVRVAYYSYKITKFCHLNYKATTRGAVLHDFFLEDYSDKKAKILVNHPKIALANSLKYFELNDLEQDIIKTHMFPCGKTLPRYLESWIVNIVDDFACFFERSYVIKESMSVGFSMIVLLFLVFVKRW